MKNEKAAKNPLFLYFLDFLKKGFIFYYIINGLDLNTTCVVCETKVAGILGVPFTFLGKGGVTASGNLWRAYKKYRESSGFLPPRQPIKTKKSKRRFAIKVIMGKNRLSPQISVSQARIDKKTARMLVNTLAAQTQKNLQK